MSRATIKKRLCLLSTLIALCAGLLVVTFSAFTDYVNQTVSYTVANFSAGGYALERTAPDGYFTAGEDISVKIKESSTENSAIDAQLTMSAAWTSPDPDSFLWGNPDESKNAVLKLDGSAIPYTVKTDGSISFSLSKVSINSSSSVTRDLVLEIPASLVGTGTVSFSFDEATVSLSGSSNDSVYSKEDLNKDEDLGFSVGVAWNISKDQSTKDIIAYLTGTSGNYNLEIIKNGKALNTNNSKMMDFTVNKSSNTEDLTKWSSSAPWYSYRAAIISVSLPDALTSIGDGAFLNLSAWETPHLTVPDKVSSIGEAAFCNVITITSVSIPKSVEIIETLAFGCLPNTNTFIFEHNSNDALSLPDNTDSPGAFHLGDPYSQSNPRATKVQYAIDAVKAYNWGTDNRGFVITAETVTGGTLTSDRKIAIQGQEINLTTTPEGEYKYNGSSYTYENENGDVQTDSLAKDILTFTMPESPVTITPKWLAPPMLAPNQSWYDDVKENTPLSPSAVTKIVLEDSYTLTGDELYWWDASDPSVPGTVTGYILYDSTSGYHIILSGNGYGKIFSNPDSTCAFGNMQDDSDYAEFQNLSDIGNIALLDTSKVVTMESMFAWLPKLTELDLSHFETGTVTNMRAMFEKCSDLISLDISSFDTSLVEAMTYMFYDCESLPSLDVSSFNTTKVTDMSGMFGFCNTISRLDLSNFDTSLVTSMSEMFWGCENLTSLDVSSFNTALVENMICMFSGCSSLESLDVTSFNTSNVTSMIYMFEECTSLTSIDVSAFNTSKVTGMSNMFMNCKSLVSLDLSNFNTENVTSMMNMFSSCEALQHLDVSNFNTSKVKNMSSMFNGCQTLNILDLSSFDTAAVISSGMDYMFNKMYKLDTVTLSSAFKFTSNSYARLPVPSSTYITGATGKWYSTDEWVKYTSAAVASAHGGKTVTYTAYPPALKRIEITTAPDKIEYTEGENFDRTGMVVQAVYTHERYPSFTKTLAEDSYTVPDGANLQEGTSKVTVSYTDTYYSIASGGVTKTASQPITVKKAGALPVLAAKDTWFSQGGTSVKKNSISSIQIVDSYNTTGKTFVDQWDASDGKVGTVTAYVEDDGTGSGKNKLTISGNGSGLIYTNPNSTSAFQNFYYSKNIDGMSLLDTSKTTTMQKMFYQTKTVSSLDLSSFETKQVTDMSYMFAGTYNYKMSLTNLDLSGFETDNVSTFANMFQYCANLKELDLSNFVTENAKTMYYMFRDCTSITNIDLSSFNTTNVTNMSGMFGYCTKLPSLDVTGFDTRNVTSFSSMFMYCQALTSLDVTGWDTGKATSMAQMFYQCWDLASLDLSGFKTGAVTSMQEMFYQANSILDFTMLKDWNVSKVTNMKGMFFRTYAEKIDISGWDMSKVTNTTSMFDQTNITKLVVPASLSVISPMFAYKTLYLDTITFMHSASDPITMPTTTGKASTDYGGDGGAFYLGTSSKLTIITDNVAVKAYPYTEDLRTVTFKSLASVQNNVSLAKQPAAFAQAIPEPEEEASSKEISLFEDMLTKAMDIATVDSYNLEYAKSVLSALEASYQNIPHGACTDDIRSDFEKVYGVLFQLITAAETSLNVPIENEQIAVDVPEPLQRTENMVEPAEEIPSETEALNVE